MAVVDTSTFQKGPSQGALTPRTWTKASRAELLRYLEELQGILGLRDWVVEVDWTPAPDVYAQVHHHQGQKRATLQLGSGFLSQPPESQRDTVVHELIHLHMFPVAEVVDRTAAELLTKQGAMVLYLAVDQQVEYATDGLAGAFAALCRLPCFDA